MCISKNTIIAVVGCFFLLAGDIAIAKSQSGVEFFASNNTNEIKIETTYNRLTGKEQFDLQNSMIKVPAFILIVLLKKVIT